MKIITKHNEIIRPIKGRAKLISKKQISDFVYEFVFEMVEPEKINFKSGQYIAIEIAFNIRRQYSISSAPEILDGSKTFEMIIDIKPNGLGVNYLMNLKPNDEIKFIGQIGLFVLPEKLKHNLYFISTGTGIAPLKSMVEDLINQKLYLKHDIKIIFGTRFIKDVFYRDLFEDYLDKGFIKDYSLYLSRPDKLYDGVNSGYVTSYFNSFFAQGLDNSQFFICGGNEMVRSMERILLDKNISDENIFYEKFY